jgi:hypothetical protein
MINERGRHIWRRNVAGRGSFCGAQKCRLRVSAEEENHDQRDGGLPTDDGSPSGSDGWAVASWFGGDHSATDSSGNPSDFAGGDSGGGGGDRGGGGD